MEDELTNLNLLDEERDAFREEASVVDNEYKFCLVGRCLTDSVVHFSSLRNTMVDLWHLIVLLIWEREGICSNFLMM